MVKTKLVFFLSALYIKIKKESKPQNVKESTFTFTKYLAKLNLYSFLSLVPIVTKFQMKFNHLKTVQVVMNPVSIYSQN